MNAINKEIDAYNFKMLEIYNFNTGVIERADAWLSQDNETIIKLRYALRANKKVYGCPSCKTGVELKKTEKGDYFFKHNQREEGVKCALIDEMSYTEKRIQAYNVSKEAEERRLETEKAELKQKNERARLARLKIQQAKAVERDKKMKQGWLEKAAENRLAKIEQQRIIALQKRAEADSIENKYPKKFSELTTAQCVELIFKNKLSRDIVNLNRRLEELRQLGFNFPDDTLSILESRHSIAKMQGMFSQIQFERASGY